MVTPALKSGPADFNSACPSSSWQSVNDVKWYTKGACYTFCHKHIVEWWKKSGLLAVSRKVGFGIGGSSMTSGLRRVDASKVSDSRFPTNGITIPVDIYILYVFQVSDSTTSLHKSLNFFSLNHVKSTIFFVTKNGVPVFAKVHIDAQMALAFALLRFLGLRSAVASKVAYRIHRRSNLCGTHIHVGVSENGVYTSLKCPL